MIRRQVLRRDNDFVKVTLHEFRDDISIKNIQSQYYSQFSINASYIFGKSLNIKNVKICKLTFLGRNQYEVVAKYLGLTIHCRA